MKRLHAIPLIMMVLVLVLGTFGCAKSTPTATVTPSPSPTLKPASTPSPTPSPAPKPAPAAPPSTFPAGVSFKGKTVTLVVSQAAGGATDIQARLYAPFLPKYLPGNPSVIVRNIPAGAHTVGTNYVYAAKPDGLTVLLTTAGQMYPQVLDIKAVHYDFLKMYLVISTALPSIYFVKAGIIDKPEDIVKARGLIGGSSGGAAAYMYATFKELLEVPVERQALAYSGGGDALRAFLSGEVNFSWLGISTYNESVASLVKKGEVMPLAQAGVMDAKGNEVRGGGLLDVPTVSELYQKIHGNPPSGIKWEAYKSVLASRSYEKGLALPPGTPASIVQAYWQACEAMVKDPEFRKVADPVNGTDTRWITGEAGDKEFKLNFGMKPEVQQWLRTTLPKYGIVVD